MSQYLLWFRNNINGKTWYYYTLFSKSPPNILKKSCLTTVRRWSRIIEYEFSLLYAVSWWHEASRGHRAFVLPQDTVDWLHAHLGDLIIDPDNSSSPAGCTTMTWVAYRMEDAIRAPLKSRNTLGFPGTRLRPSQFLWAEKITGFINLNEVGGRSFFRTASDGRIREQGVRRGEWGEYPRINRRRPRPIPYRDDHEKYPDCRYDFKRSWRPPAWPWDGIG